ncbi:MAG: acylneuraminate cytidylyltransferase family protein [Proteobacteria bacterium]|nr:acylneuraminate cytidylyltransferase family protein [Pseudomonadota bacterium]
MPKRLAIVPARGGSKRIKNKNIRDFCGTPMITHILKTAGDSKLFSKIHVSTEDEAIRAVVAKHGFDPEFARPKSLSDDYTPIMPVLRFTTEEYQRLGEHFDEVWCLMACAPLINSGDLVAAADLYKKNLGKRQLLAVSEFPVPIEWAFTRSQIGILNPVQPGQFAVRSQDLEPHYFDAAAFSIFPPSQIFESIGSGSDENFVGYILPKSRALDIDNEDDWLLAENLYRARNS